MIMSDDEITEEHKNWIDNADYVQLLRRWRHAPLGDDAIFSGATGKYYSKVMNEAKSVLDHDERVGASKLVGW